MINFRQAVLLLLLPALHAAGQNVPAASAVLPYTGFELPDVSGTLRLSLSASERFISGYDGTNGFSSGLSGSGSAAYLSGSTLNPFSAVYTGGVLQGGATGPTRLLSSLSLSQVAQVGLFRFIVADGVSYTPQNPVTGLSGVPGLGDLNVAPLPGSTTGDEIQTVDVPILTNTVSGTVVYTLSGSTTASATAGQSITRYLGVPGGSTFDENSTFYSAGLHRQFSPITTVGLQYSNSDFNYLSLGFAIRSQSLSVVASRKVTPYLTIDGSIGPQFTASSNSAIEPSNTSYAASGSIAYRNSIANASINFSRGVNAGSGLLSSAAESTNISGRLDRQFGDYVHLAADASFSSYSGLQTGSITTSGGTIGLADGNANLHDLVISGQANRAILSHVSAFASYTVQRQLNNGSAGVSPLVLSGTIQTFSFGVSYTPDAIRIGRH